MTSSPTEDKRGRFESAALPFLSAVYNMAWRLTRNPEDAREIAQETYLRAYRTFESFRPGTNCRAWLFTILYSIFVNRYRKRRREPRMVSLEELEERSDRSLMIEERQRPTAEPGEAPRWSDVEVHEAFGKLPESFRAVVLLVDVEELSYEEAAAALGCPVGTIRSRLFRARSQLQSALGGYARRAGYGRGEGKIE